MSRYYAIALTNPKTGAPIISKALAGLGNTGATYTSFVGGKSLPGALNVEMDIFVAPLGLPSGLQTVTIWGIPLEEISQANDLNGAAISVYGGMQAGLPLANPKQSGLLAAGYVFQAYGNWVGTEQTLNLVIAPFATTAVPPNLVLNWKKGTTLASAIDTTLKAAYPGLKTNIAISPNLVVANDVTSPFDSIVSFAQFVKARSAEIVGGNYAGVDVRLTQGTFYAYDGTTQAAPKALAFADFIGQPTWINPSTVQSKLVMRSDLLPGDFITFPKTPVIANPGTVNPLINQKLTFQGSFLITYVRHVGNYRQADASSWVTVVDAATTPVSALAA